MLNFIEPTNLPSIANIKVHTVEIDRRNVSYSLEIEPCRSSLPHYTILECFKCPSCSHLIESSIMDTRLEKKASWIIYREENELYELYSHLMELYNNSRKGYDPKLVGVTTPPLSPKSRTKSLPHLVGVEDLSPPPEPPTFLLTREVSQGKPQRDEYSITQVQSFLNGTFSYLRDVLEMASKRSLDGHSHFVDFDDIPFSISRTPPQNSSMPNISTSKEHFIGSVMQILVNFISLRKTDAAVFEPSCNSSEISEGWRNSCSLGEFSNSYGDESSDLDGLSSTILLKKERLEGFKETKNRDAVEQHQQETTLELSSTEDVDHMEIEYPENIQMELDKKARESFTRLTVDLDISSLENVLEKLNIIEKANAPINQTFEAQEKVFNPCVKYGARKSSLRHRTLAQRRWIKQLEGEKEQERKGGLTLEKKSVSWKEPMTCKFSPLPTFENDEIIVETTADSCENSINKEDHISNGVRSTVGNQFSPYPNLKELDFEAVEVDLQSSDRYMIRSMMETSLLSPIYEVNTGLVRSKSERKANEQKGDKILNEAIKERFMGRHSGFPIRVVLNGKQSRFLFLPMSINYKTLYQRVQQKFRLDPKVRLQLSYLDPNGELIRVVDDEDVELAIREFEVNVPARLIFHITEI